MIIQKANETGHPASALKSEIRNEINITFCDKKRSVNRSRLVKILQSQG